MIYTFLAPQIPSMTIPAGSYPTAPPPPSFADMAFGIVPPVPPLMGGGPRPPYRGRGTFHRGRGGDRYNHEDGRPQRQHSRGHDNPRHRPYENRHGNFRGGSNNNNEGGGGHREHRR